MKLNDKTMPTIREIFIVFAKIGLLSFGGPAAQIALMHRVIVEENTWLSERQYLNALSFCMLLPGPEAMQLATYSGWRMRGTLGGLVAGILFVLPGAFVILILSIIYAYFGSVPLINSLFLGIKAAVIIIVIQALFRVSKHALKEIKYWIIAGLAFVAIFFFALPYPLIIFLAATIGFFTSDHKKNISVSVKNQTSLLSTFKIIAIWLFLWWAPVGLLHLYSPQPILIDIADFFSRLASVTFGGAYAVLTYMTQDVVTDLHWISAGEMMDGLGLAETTPGPLILVTEFVGFLAAFHEDGIGLALWGAVVTLWVTFIPCFLWIFAGAPYIEWISAQPRLKSALEAITAAVVGVILNLSIWFILHVFFKTINRQDYGPITFLHPKITTLDWHAAILTIFCAILLLKYRYNIISVLCISALLALAIVNINI